MAADEKLMKAVGDKTRCLVTPLNASSESTRMRESYLADLNKKRGLEKLIRSNKLWFSYFFNNGEMRGVLGSTYGDPIPKASGYTTDFENCHPGEVINWKTLLSALVEPA